MTLQFGRVPDMEEAPRYNPALAEDVRNGAVLSVLSRNGELKQSMQELQEQTRDLPAAALAAEGRLPYEGSINGMMPSHTAVQDPQNPAVRANFYGPNGNQAELVQVPALQAQSTQHYASTGPAQVATDQARAQEFMQNNALNSPALRGALERNSAVLSTLRRRN